MMNREWMRRWCNAMCCDLGPDAEVREIDELEDAIAPLAPRAENIRGLIARIDSVCHYKAFENIAFIMKAIGEGDYPECPAVDVLWRCGDIGEERRDHARRYIHSIRAWLDGRDLEKAAGERPDCAEILQTAYELLGEMDEGKRWLVMCLLKTLKEHAWTPWDFIAAYGDEQFVRALHESVLRRQPSPGELTSGIEELRQGKAREQMVAEVIDCAEHKLSELKRMHERLVNGVPD